MLTDTKKHEKVVRASPAGLPIRPPVVRTYLREQKIGKRTPNGATNDPRVTHLCPRFSPRLGRPRHVRASGPDTYMPTCHSHLLILFFLFLFFSFPFLTFSTTHARCISAALPERARRRRAATAARRTSSRRSSSSSRCPTHQRSSSRPARSRPAVRAPAGARPPIGASRSCSSRRCPPRLRPPGPPPPEQYKISPPARAPAPPSLASTPPSLAPAPPARAPASSDGHCDEIERGHCDEIERGNRASAFLGKKIGSGCSLGTPVDANGRLAFLCPWTDPNGPNQIDSNTKIDRPIGDALTL
jgi:hypothetical protein